MSVRVRFAPSPTGYLHVGGARTALYNYLYARAMGGTFVLRIEDTDLERSSRAYEESQIKDLLWLGIEIDEGPYRQSERLPIYAEYADKLIKQGKAYHCFCSAEELEAKKEKANQAGLAPHYDGKCRNVTEVEAKARIASGEKAVVRFKAPQKSYVFHDKIRDRVVFPEGMVGDFVILRSDGMPVYNYCCVVDDMLMKITHVLRAEEHLPNTLRQLMLYEALEASAPVFAHLSLLIGHDRQKLSKRHGATSVSLYREETYLPQAMVNYLTLLGWSHPDEKDIFDIEELKKIFNLDRFSKSPAIFDVVKFAWVNGQHIKLMPLEKLVPAVKAVIGEISISDDHLTKAVQLFRDKVNFFKEFTPLIQDLFKTEIVRSGEIDEVLQWESTPKIVQLLKQKIENCQADYIDEKMLEEWMNEAKKDLQIKGKFLFMGFRVALTGEAHGSELKSMLPLMPRSVVQMRNKKVLEWLNE